MERLTEELQSKRNRLFWRMREAIRFQRPGYRENGNGSAHLDPEAARLCDAYGLAALQPNLSSAVLEKNLATLWILEQMLDGIPLPGGPLSVLEPGCQDFARLPALRAYLRARNTDPVITGLEVDAYPILHNLHSRADKARYYLALPGGHARDSFRAGDFFRWCDPAELLLCFYPFVSANPALSWGLPKEFGRPELWIEAFARNLKAGGKLLVVHQGPWEEEEFDEARAEAPLRLLRRAEVNCHFYPLPHPACASVYERSAD